MKIVAIIFFGLTPQQLSNKLGFINRTLRKVFLQLHGHAQNTQWFPHTLDLLIL